MPTIAIGGRRRFGGSNAARSASASSFPTGGAAVLVGTGGSERIHAPPTVPTRPTAPRPLQSISAFSSDLTSPMQCAGDRATQATDGGERADRVIDLPSISRHRPVRRQSVPGLLVDFVIDWDVDRQRYDKRGNHQQQTDEGEINS